jgi:hypothetical protein
MAAFEVRKTSKNVQMFNSNRTVNTLSDLAVQQRTAHMNLTTSPTLEE